MHGGESVRPSVDQTKGHEFTGTVEEIGSEVNNFRKGDQIVCPFTISWFVSTSEIV